MLREDKDSWRCKKSREKYLNDIKIYARIKKEIDFLIQTLPQDVGNDFRIKKNTMKKRRNWTTRLEMQAEVENGQEI